MEKAMSLDPAEPWAAMYGSFLIQARRFEKAERQLNREIMIDPNWWIAYRRLFHLYIKFGRFDEAFKVAEKRKREHKKNWKKQSLLLCKH
jgi:predicted Zn-dependent protease